MMTSSAAFRLVSAAKLPLLVSAFGILINFAGPNTAVRNAGAAITYLGVGAAATVATRRDGQLSELRKLSDRYSREKGALQRSVLTAQSEAAKAHQQVQRYTELTARSDAAFTKLTQSALEMKAERDRLKALLDEMTGNCETCRDDNSLIAGQLETLEIERVQLIAELYETAVEEVELSVSIAGLENQFRNDSAYQLTQKKKAKSELTKARANFHTDVAELQTRIEDLEAQLSEKTALANQMLTELNSDAQGKLTQFGGKANAQTEMIRSLQAQLEEYRKTNQALTHIRFDTVGTDNTIGNRLIDALAKAGSTYGASHNEREGHNGRLKVWLKMIDAPLKRAQDALDDIEAELSLWAKPSVKVDRGMHLFTLATEQEHKVLAAPNVPLTRLEKTLDSAIHARIVGGSGSGKTVLLNNLMHYMAATMKGANVTLLDPKAVDDWGMFTPRYWGEECVEGIVDLADSLKGRVSQTVRARKAGKPAPDYAPELFIVDEAQYNYLLAQNADDSHIKERGEQAPNYAKKAKGALAGLLSLGRAYNAIGLFVTQLPQVSKVGLNEGSFDPCVNIFLGKQIDNAISGFLPDSGYSQTKCKALEKELNTRRQLGQQWVMLVADLPRSEAYLMECPAPGYYHNRFSGDLGQFTEVVKPVEKLQSPTESETQSCKDSTGADGLTDGLQPSTAVLQPSAHCPKCTHLSRKVHGNKPQKNGKYRFACENTDCDKKTFSAFPLA